MVKLPDLDEFDRRQITVRDERRFSRMVRSQQSQSLTQITTQLNDGASRTTNVLKQSVKSHHTEPTNLTELYTALANIWQIILVERFKKLVESMSHLAAAVFKARAGPTCY
ncbi:hypothetical protein TNCV_3641531 [Trichonephila clavipes]|nr:hypothetical protein TNCV_3641531 [Trichonephila clavipes]